MYKLYNVKNWGSISAHLLLEELGVPYQNVWMTPEQVAAPEFRDISPLGLVPALGLAGGRAMFESAAIVAHLVTVHPDKGMAPMPGTPDHGIFLSWLAYMAANLYPAVDWAMNLEHYVEGAGANTRYQEIGTRRFDDRMGIVEQHFIEEGPYMMGKEFSALDPYLFMFTLWAKPSEAAAREKFPKVARVADEVRARPKLKAVLEAHGVLEPAPA
jgi:glutathione S-transferase